MRTAIALFTLLCALSSTAAGEKDSRVPDQVPFDRQALLMLRVLAYDQNLHKRVSGNLTIAVIHGQTPESERVQAAMVEALKKISQESTVSGLQVRAVDVEYADPGTFEARLTSSGAAVLYVCPGLEKDALQTIADVAHRHSMLSFSGRESDVGLGVGIALVRRSARAAIIIDRSMVADAGANLSPELLRVSEVRE
ncbi:YfiR family protein [Vitiosangium sp. GDMCC 1.1324]|uniref:YfiR family protein n=1 Tax=Vitiosangium sp. (strain GDMCC 1.1324) TaxID=2138576 RepID=UPI000D33F4C0|nr:YfiR family protein [Vitiosangium sp. GDMCC 1.1324]PTL76639.1 DUF4154 domain-containing protein [Vitiosangium sp. GDMCC 1.1324]